MNADESPHLSDSEERAVNVGNGAAPGVMTDAEALVRHAEHNLGADHVSGQAKGVNLRSGHRGPHAILERHSSGRSGPWSPGAAPSTALRELPGRAARRTDFVVVRQAQSPFTCRGAVTCDTPPSEFQRTVVLKPNAERSRWIDEEEQQ